MTLTDSTAEIEYGQTTGKARMIMQVDGLDAQGLKAPSLVSNTRDLGSPTPPPIEKIEIKSTELQPAGATSRVFLLLVTVADLPANSPRVDT